jgi:uncharacterized metal-binding protein
LPVAGLFVSGGWSALYFFALPYGSGIRPRTEMTTAWLLGTISLYATTFGALLIFLYLSNSPRSAENWQSPEGKVAYTRHRRRLLAAVGLLAGWLVVQDLGVIFL